MNNQDITKVLKSIEICDAKSKNGMPYTYIKITLVNGYTHRIFTRDAENFAWDNAIEMAYGKTTN